VKKTTILFTVLGLCICAWAADNAVTAPQSAANPQSAIDNRQSTIVSGAEAITIPQMLSYQGKLTDTLGVPVANGNYPMMFLLYSAPSGGSSFWSENQSVTTKSLSVNTSCIVLIERYALAHECTPVMDHIGRSVGACRVADTEAPTGQRTQVQAPAGRGPETDGTTPGV
jgi:hypothetical protein